MIEVTWGAGFKDRYIRWLEKKWFVGIMSGITFAVGAFLLIFQAVAGRFTLWYAVGLILYVAVMLLLSIFLAVINKRIHSIEIYLDFYEQRHEVRHEVFCKHHFHCVGLHYFKSYEDESIPD